MNYQDRHKAPSQSSEQGAPERIWLDMNDGYEVIGAEGMGLPEYTRSDICASARREAFDEAIAIARKMGIAWGVDATDSDDPEPWLNHERAAHRIEQSLIDARDTTPKEMEK